MSHEKDKLKPIDFDKVAADAMSSGDPFAVLDLEELRKQAGIEGFLQTRGPTPKPLTSNDVYVNLNEKEREKLKSSKGAKVRQEATKG